MKFSLLLTSVISAISFLPGTYAWGQDGHAVVATIAEVYLEPNVLPTLCSILGTSKTCSLASVASWADQIKQKMKWSAALHYVNPIADHPPQLCVFPGAKGWDGKKGANVLAAIRNTTNILNEWAQGSGVADDAAASEALKFLIHFIGDLHMPFHLTGREQGANGVWVKWGGRKVKLHGLWDGDLVERAIQNTPSKWVTPLSSNIESHLHGSKYDPLIRKSLSQGIGQLWKTEYQGWVKCPSIPPNHPLDDDQTVLVTKWDPSEVDDDFVCPWFWATPIQKLTCDWAWPKELDQPPYDEHGGPLLQLDTEKYGGKIAKEWVIEKLLTTAGLRLASILNQVFVQPEAF